MNYWIVTDTHFGHVDRMVELCDRPEDYQEKILYNISLNVKPEDIFICLGDVVLNSKIESEAHRLLLLAAPCSSRWLILGNHDKKSMAWYRDKGWDTAVESICLNIYGKKILLSHKPQQVPDGYLNIHGHCHNKDGGKTGEDVLGEGKNLLIAMEHEYKPYLLRGLVEYVNAKKY